jgi:hypothetical protein
MRSGCRAGRPVIFGEATTIVRARPVDVLDFVMDLERYRQADTKIQRVKSVRRDGDVAEVVFKSRLRALPTPWVKQIVRLTPGKRIDITSAPSWQNKLVEFRGFVECAETGEGTRVTHYEGFTFKGPMRWFAEPYLRDWLRTDVEAEVDRIKAMVDR